MRSLHHDRAEPAHHRLAPDHRQEPADVRLSAGGGCCVRGEPHRRCGAMPSCREGGRLDLRISLGRATQAPLDQHGRGGLVDFGLRIEAVDWVRVHADLDAQGWAIAPQLLTEAQANSLSDLYRQERCFRSHIIMSRHGFGRGEYKYFSYPLPPLIHSLRTVAYPKLAPIANAWSERMHDTARFP